MNLLQRNIRFAAILLSIAGVWHVIGPATVINIAPKIAKQNDNYCCDTNHVRSYGLYEPDITELGLSVYFTGQVASYGENRSKTGVELISSGYKEEAQTNLIFFLLFALYFAGSLRLHLEPFMIKKIKRWFR